MIWKQIKDYEGLYEISEDGNIRNKKGSLKIVSPNKRGYKRVTLCKNGKEKIISIHRLVAEAFIPNPENKPQVNHINGIRSDNNVENLEWCTQSENQLHAFSTGLQKGNVGESNGRSKITDLQAKEIRSLYNDNRASPAKLSKQFNVSPKTIRRIISSKTFNNI